MEVVDKQIISEAFEVALSLYPEASKAISFLTGALLTFPGINIINDKPEQHNNQPKEQA